MIIDPNCTICRNPHRSYIDLAVRNQGQRATAKQFEVSRQAIQRHIEKGHCTEPSSNTKFEPIKFVNLDPKSKTPKVAAKETLPDGAVIEQPKRAPKSALDAERRANAGIESALAAITDYGERKAYVGKLLRTGTFDGMLTLERLRGCWSDLSLLQLAEIVAQAAMEADFLRGTKQARRLVAIAKAERIHKECMDKGNHPTALKALEFTTKLDGLFAEADLATALAASQAWSIAAKVLQTKYPEAFEAIHGELVTEEARRRQALAPVTIEATTEG
jgi:hypothetical protein